MRILVVTVAQAPLDGRIHARQIRSLLDAGCEVTYAAPWSSFGQETGDEIRVIDLPRASGLGRVAALRAARGVIRAEAAGHDLVLIHDPELLLVGKAVGGVPVVWDVHAHIGLWASRPAAPGWIKAPLKRLERRCVRAVEARYHLILTEPLTENGFEFSHPIVLDVPWVPDGTCEPSQPRVVHLGRVSRERGAQELIALGRALGPDLTLELLGDVDDEVAALVAAAVVAGEVVWPGPIDHAAAARRVRGAIVGVSMLQDHPHLRASTPTAVLDCLAQGVPVVTTPLPPARDLVEAADAGAVVGFGDVLAAVEAVRALAGDVQRRLTAGRHGWEHVRRTHDWQVEGPRFVGLLREFAALGRLDAPGFALSDLAHEPVGRLQVAAMLVSAALGVAVGLDVSPIFGALVGFGGAGATRLGASLVRGGRRRRRWRLSHAAVMEARSRGRDLERQAQSEPAVVAASVRRDDRGTRAAIEEVRRLGRAHEAGFRARALARLTAGPEAMEHPAVRAQRHHELAVIAAAEGRFEEAYELVARAATDEFANPRILRARALLHADVALTIGDTATSRSVLARLQERDGVHPDIVLRVGAVDGPLGSTAALSQLLRGAGIEELELNPDVGTIDGLSTSAPAGSVDGPCVSIVMPVRDAERTVATALTSLLAQTWGNLEVVVVDDASTDRSVAVVSEIAERDLRVTLVRSSAVGGAYVARNRGATLTSGPFLGVMDADDWVHPRRIERQMEVMVGDPTVLATTSDLVRVDDDLRARWVPPRRPRAQLVSLNGSSLLVRRELDTSIGLWDTARGGSDGEYLERLAAATGRPPTRVSPGVPLMLARNSPGSLTASRSRTGVASAAQVLGARWLYRASYRAWHVSESFAADLPLRPDLGAPRPFFVPPVLAAAPADLVSSLAVLVDCRPAGPRGVLYRLDQVRAALAVDVPVAVVHTPVSGSERPLTGMPDPAVMLRARAGEVLLPVLGDTVRAEEVVVLDASALLAVPDDFPTIVAARWTVLIDGPASGPLESAVRGMAGPAAAVRWIRSTEHLGSQLAPLDVDHRAGGLPLQTREDTS